MTNVSDLAASLPFLPVKQRNAALDGLFYDTGSLTPDEVANLSPLADREGSIIVVPPSGSGRPIRHYRKALRFMNKEGDGIRAIAVAGVGSSVLGTAALARNVADAQGFDVAGIVTGYGLSNLMTEALGGWFVFGAADRTRLYWETLVGRATTTLPEAPAPTASEASAEKNASEGLESVPPYLAGMPGNQDLSTLVDILMARPAKLELLVGHSKGSLLIDFVLEQFVEELEGDDHPLFDELQIVTFGAVVDIPDQFRRVQQYLGNLDWFGGMNSRLSIPHQRVPNAWHHLNRKLPYHLDVLAALRAAPLAS